MGDTEDQARKKMQEISDGIENAILLCADDREQLMLACCMLQKTSEIYERIMGKESRRVLFLEAAII